MCTTMETGYKKNLAVQCGGYQVNCVTKEHGMQLQLYYTVIDIEYQTSITRMEIRNTISIKNHKLQKRTLQEQLHYTPHNYTSSHNHKTCTYANYTRGMHSWLVVNCS